VRPEKSEIRPARRAVLCAQARRHSDQAERDDNGCRPPADPGRNVHAKRDEPINAIPKKPPTEKSQITPQRAICPVFSASINR